MRVSNPVKGTITTVLLCLIACQEKDGGTEPPGPTPPQGLHASYDTLSGTVSLSWQASSLAGKAGYAVFRSRRGSTAVDRLNEEAVIKESYEDKVFSDSLDTASFAFDYRVAVLDGDLNQGPFSKPLAVDAESPTRARTFLTLSSSADTVGIGDTAVLVAEFRNATRKVAWTAWVVDGKEAGKREWNSLAGRDTLRLMRNLAGAAAIGTKAYDAGGRLWTQARNLRILSAPPRADAGPDLEAYRGAPIRLQGSASDSLGEIVKYEWDLGGDGIFTATSGAAADAAAPFRPGIYRYVLRVTDDDGQMGLDTAMLKVYELGEHWSRSESRLPVFGPDIGRILIDRHSSFLLLTSRVYHRGFLPAQVWKSEDGREWAKLADSAGFGYRSSFEAVEFLGSVWVIGGEKDWQTDHQDIWSSTDGINWIRIADSVPFGPDTRAIHAFPHAGRVWVIAADSSLWFSSNGDDWDRVGVAPIGGGSVHSSAKFGEEWWFVASGTAYVTKDWVNWSSRNLPAGPPSASPKILAADGRLYLNDGSRIYSILEGTEWKVLFEPKGNTFLNPGLRGFSFFKVPGFFTTLLTLGGATSKGITNESIWYSK